VPVVLRAVDPQVSMSAKKAIAKSGAMALVYTILYLAMGVWAIRRIRASKRAQGQ